MNHEANLIGLLNPLGVYDLTSESINRAELGAWGKGLDNCRAVLEEIGREMSLMTAEGYGLERVEELLPYRPASSTTEARRQALAALLRIGGDSFTLAAVNDTISGCGIKAAVTEGEEPGQVQVSFPGLMGIPPSFENLKTIIGDILPCHLEIMYHLWYHSWEESRERTPTWADAAGYGWYELSTIQ